jgi:hypothetical protein
MPINFSADPTTELEAVNMMLLSIGKAPVNTIATSAINDVSWATTTLYNVVRDVQHTAWWFNRETEFPITLDANGYANRPTSVLDLKPNDRSLPLVERQSKLYDLGNHTFDLRARVPAGVLKVDVTWCFPYEDLPMAARMYIAMRAARQFQTSAVGSQVIYQFTKEMELEARAELERSELRNSATNMFNTTTRNSRIYNRQPGAAKNNAWY